MRGMNVADFEAGALAGQAARTQRRNTALVGDFRQRIVLIHELRQLRGAEELLDCSRHRLGVDQLLRAEIVGFGHRQTIAHRALDPDQADAEHVLGHFADRTHAPVTQVIDIVDRAATVADLAQHVQHIEDVGAFAVVLDQCLGRLVVAVAEEPVVVEHTRPQNFLVADPAIELHPANGRQVVAVEGKEQVVEQVLRRVLGRRLTRTHHPVDFHQRFQLGLARIDAQGIGNVRTAVEIVDPQGAQRLDAGLAERRQLIVADFIVGAGQQLAGRRVDYIVSQHASDKVVVGHAQRFNASVLKLLDVPRSDALAGFDQHLAIGQQVETQGLAAQALRNQLQLDKAFLVQMERVDVVEDAQHLLVLVTERAQQDGDRQLAATVDAGEQRIARIELEVEPGAAVGNDPRVEQQFA